MMKRKRGKTNHRRRLKHFLIAGIAIIVFGFLCCLSTALVLSDDFRSSTVKLLTSVAAYCFYTAIASATAVFIPMKIREKQLLKALRQTKRTLYAVQHKTEQLEKGMEEKRRKAFWDSYQKKWM